MAMRFDMDQAKVDRKFENLQEQYGDECGPVAASGSLCLLDIRFHHLYLPAEHPILSLSEK